MMKAVVYKDRGKQWRWRIFARNGRVVASSGEAFDSKGNAARSLKSFIRSIIKAHDENRIMYEVGAA